MSVPIKYCQLVRAIDDDEAYAKIAPVMKRNLEGGYFTVWPCNCDPPCRRVAEDEQRELLARFRNEP